jgi:LEA14-like dessication related protein
MKIGNALLIAGGLFLGYNLLQLVSAGSNVQVVFNGVTMNSPLSYTLDFLIQNVTNATVKLNALTGTVSINGTQVGNLSDFQPVTIGPTSQQDIKMNLSLSPLGLAGSVAQLLTQTGQTLNFVVDGALNVDGIVFPFNVTNTLTI